jgi:hypothetical protein
MHTMTMTEPDLGADAGGKRPKTRIVQFRFRGLSSNHYMTIGKIELYGRVPQPLESPEQAYVLFLPPKRALSPSRRA